MTTTTRNIKHDFIKYASANILGMIGFSLYILADTFFIANATGSTGLAALNIALPYYNVFNGLGMMIGTGGATRFALNRSKSIFTQCLFLTLLLSIPVFVLGVIFTEPLALFMGANEETLEMTKVYLRTLSTFSPMFMLNNLFMAFIRNDGSPGLSMAGMLTSSFSNVIMDYLLMYPCNLGLFGAALATGIAPIASMSIMSIHFIKRKHTFHFIKERPDPTQWKTVFSLGLFAFVTELASGIAILLYNYLVLDLAGNIGVAAYGVVANIALVAIYIFTGISQGMQPVASNCIGHGQYDDAKKVRRYGWFTAIGLSIVFYMIIFFFTDPIVAAFNSENNSELADIARQGLLLYFIGLFFAGINVISIAYQSAVGNGIRAFILSLLRGVLLLAPVAFLMAKCFGMTGIWLSLAITEILVIFIVFITEHRPCT